PGRREPYRLHGGCAETAARRRLGPGGAGRLLEQFWADNSARGPVEMLVNNWPVAVSTAVT
ncbi:MAG: hypothetical protein ACRDOD_07130, partial [Streptosporangiaceae bacterium]